MTFRWWITRSALGAVQRYMSYASAMGDLLACPFCRDLFASGEAKHCPNCEAVKLVPLDRLPPSLEQITTESAKWEATPPQDRELSWTYLGRGKGLLLALLVALMVLFFLPWVELSKPEITTLSGFELARSRAGWLWGGFAGQLTGLAVLLSRRSITQMRGVRVILAVFSAMTVIETGMILSSPPAQHRLLPIDYTWGWALYASLALGVVATLIAATLGGRKNDFPADFGKPAALPDETSAGQTLH